MHDNNRDSMCLTAKIRCISIVTHFGWDHKIKADINIIKKLVLFKQITFVTCKGTGLLTIYKVSLCALLMVLKCINELQLGMGLEQLSEIIPTLLLWNMPLSHKTIGKYPIESY